MHTNGFYSIIDEREEQISKHGYTKEMDKGYVNGELIEAAMFCLEQACKLTNRINDNCHWPKGWNETSKAKIMQKNITGKLKVAGAFLLAEDDRNGIIPCKLLRITKRIGKLIDTINNKAFSTKESKKIHEIISELAVMLPQTTA